MIKTVEQKLLEHNNVRRFVLDKPAKYGDIVSTPYGDVRLDQWFYVSYRPDKIRANTIDEQVCYCQPGLQTVGRGLGRAVHAAAITQLGLPGLIPCKSHPGKTVTLYAENDHTKGFAADIVLSKTDSKLDIYQIVEQRGQLPYAIIEFTQHNGGTRVILDRPLDGPILRGEPLEIRPSIDVSPADYNNKLVLVSTVPDAPPAISDDLVCKTYVEDGLTLRYVRQGGVVTLDMLAGVVRVEE